MREFLFRRFGAGQPEVLEDRIRKYLLGMPEEKSGKAFPTRCDMEQKLDELEAEREYLLEMCPKEQRETYEDGQDHPEVSPKGVRRRCEDSHEPTQDKAV